MNIKKRTIKKGVFIFLLPFFCATTFAISNDALQPGINQNSFHWESLHGPYTNIAMKAIQAKSNPNTLYLFKSDSFMLFKSLDAGSSWQEIKLPEGAELTDLASTDEKSLLLGTERGIYISHDQGSHWTYLNNSPKKIFRIYVANPQLIVAEMKDFHNFLGIYISTDYGLTWQLGGEGLDQPANIHDFSDVVGVGKSLAIHTEEDGIKVSTDGGLTWSSKNNQWRKFISYFNGYDRSIAVTSDLDIYVSGLYWVGKDYAHGTFKTDFTGKTWEKLFDNTGKMVVDKNNNIYYLNLSDRYDHSLLKSMDKGKTWKLLKKFTLDEDADISFEDMQILENNRILINTTDGYWLSDESQTQFSFTTKQFTASIVSSVASLGNAIVAAVVDPKISYKRMLQKSDDDGKSWSKNFNEDVYDVFVFKNQLVTLSNDDEIFVSDQGTTWQKKYQFKGNWLIQNINHNDDTVWLQVNNQLYLTHDLVNWIPYNANKMLTTISGNRIYGLSWGEQDGINRIKFSEDNGKTWTTLSEINRGSPCGITSYKANLLIATFENAPYIIKSIDGGKHWDPINVGLTDAHVCKVDILDELHYIAATHEGIFYTQDGGQHWDVENDGLINKDVLSTFANQHDIYLGTNGAGIYRAKIN